MRGYLPTVMRWRRILAVARVMLAAACVAGQFRLWPHLSWPQALASLALGWYSIAVLVAKGPGRPSHPLLRQIVDVAFFLGIAFFDSVAGFWLACVFYLYLLTGAAILHGWPGVATVMLVSLARLLLVSAADTLPQLATILASGATAAVFSFERRKFIGRLSAADRLTASLRGEGERAREAERQRVAADFHDGPLQSFISFQMRLEIVRKWLDRDLNTGRQELAQLQELCRNQVAEMRAFIRGMRPVEVDGAGLAASVRRLVEGFQKDSGIRASFAGGEVSDPAETEYSLEVLQIVRESLHNVQKHSRASRVAVGLEKSGGELRLSVEDDGSGFPFSGSYSLEELDLLSLGPLSIKRRVRNLAGDMTVESRPGRGATLRIRIPS